MSDRTRGTLVFPIDIESKDSTVTMGNGDTYALGINPHTGETFMIHGEGVSYVVTHAQPFRFNDFNLSSPWHSVLTVRGWREGVEPVDLADWVRSFGSRLESNFHTAHRLLNATTPQKDADEEHIRQHIAKIDPLTA